MWLYEILSEFFEAVASGDKSWKPFLLSVAACTVLAIALYVWVG